MDDEILKRLELLLCSVGHHGSFLDPEMGHYEIGEAEIEEAQKLFDIVKQHRAEQ